MSSDTLPGSRELAKTHVKKMLANGNWYYWVWDLCIPGTSVPSERFFFSRRNALKPKHINMVLFLNKNL